MQTINHNGTLSYLTIKDKLFIIIKIITKLSSRTQYSQTEKQKHHWNLLECPLCQEGYENIPRFFVQICNEKADVESIRCKFSKMCTYIYRDTIVMVWRFLLVGIILWRNWYWNHRIESSLYKWTEFQDYFVMWTVSSHLK